MKLELKHLAPYLPYNLRFRDSYAGDVSDYLLTANNVSYWSIGHINPLLPILRPISDLINLMPNKDVCYISYMWYEIIGADSDSFDKDDFFDQCEIGNISFLPAMVIPKLLEWHFDVFGLIDAGLAIDINTLNK